MFLNQSKLLEKNDFLIYYNGDSLFLKDIEIEEVMNVKSSILCLEHMYAWNVPRESFGYCKDPRSLAYIKPSEGHHYFAGGIIGGWTRQFLKKCEECFDNIKIDLQNNIMPMFHDESHWNRLMENYIQKDHYPFVLNPTIYGHYEKFDNLKMRFRIKSEYLDVNEIKREKPNNYSFFKINCKNLITQIIDYLIYLKVLEKNPNMKIILDSNKQNFYLDKIPSLKEFLWENVLTTMDYDKWMLKVINFNNENIDFTEEHCVYINHIENNVSEDIIDYYINFNYFSSNQQLNKYLDYIDENTVMLEFDNNKFQKNSEYYIQKRNG